MAKPRKKWEPEYRVGAAQRTWMVPPPRGKNQVRPAIKRPNPKRKKK